MFYVYEWYIVETGEIIYVGKGCGRRYKVRKHNRFFNDMIRRYNCASRIVEKFENEKDAFDYEYTYIRTLKENGQCVCNIYDGGTGGTVSWWTDEIRTRYSEKNVMKSEMQRNRMKLNNPMKDPSVALKTNGQKRRKVTIDGTTYCSIKEAAEKYGVNNYTILSWCSKGISPNGKTCSIEPQKQYRHKHNTQGNQKPSQGNVDKSTLDGSTTNG